MDTPLVAFQQLFAACDYLVRDWQQNGGTISVEGKHTLLKLSRLLQDANNMVSAASPTKNLRNASFIDELNVLFLFFSVFMKFRNREESVAFLLSDTQLVPMEVNYALVHCVADELLALKGPLALALPPEARRKSTKLANDNRIYAPDFYSALLDFLSETYWKEYLTSLDTVKLVLGFQ